MRAWSPLRGGALNRVDDVLVARAAAEIPRDALADLAFGRRGVVGEQRDGGHDHARRAVAALQPVLVPERLLHPVQLAITGEALDRGDLGTVGLDGERRARLHAPSVNEHRTGAALTRIAPDVRAGQPEVLPQEVNEEEPWLDARGPDLAVHGDGDGHLRHRVSSVSASRRFE